MKAKISEVVDAIVGDILKLTKEVAEEYNISQTDFDKIMQIQVSKKDNPVISLVFNEYIEYTNNMPGIENSSIDKLRDWAMDHDIFPDNEVLWTILQTLKKTIISKHSIKEIIEERIEQNWINKWADDFYKAITSELDSIFSK